jgi:uncharacterized protein (DUF1015 family)
MVPRFEPFPGVRYDPSRVVLDEVVAPPYDVIDASRRAFLAGRSPYNVVHVDLPEGGDDRYRQAAETFAAWRRDEILETDATAAFYGYRMRFVDETGKARRTIGVFGAMTLSRPGEGDILPHENTTPKAKSDRLDLIRATATNLSAIWALTPDSRLTDLLVGDGDEPAGSWRASDDVEHDLWRITDPTRVAAITETIDAAPLVIADGHHRYETSLAYRDERRAAAASEGHEVGGRYDAAMTFVVALDERELTVLPIHRLIDGLPSGFDLEAALSESFIVSDAGEIDATIARRMDEAGALCLVLADGARFLVPRPSAMDGVRDLDTARLDRALEPVPSFELTFQHGVDHIVQRVRSGDAQAGVLLRPVPVPLIAAVAEGGERMPPKSTYFHPKPSTGAVFRVL